MSDILGIGASGLRAYSRALATVGDNIANAQTPGYTRRTLALQETVGAGDTLFTRTHVRPGGVEVVGVVRATDEWLAEEARLATSDGERSRLVLDAMLGIETALADTNNGIGTALTQLLGTADALTLDPANMALRSQFLDNVDAIAVGFRTAGEQIDRLSSANLAAASGDVSQFNTDLQALEKVNAGLRRARPGSTNEAALLDDRDRLLEQLASRLDVTANFGNRGTVTLRAASSGDLLVGGGTFQSVNITADASGRIAYSVAGQPLVAGSGALAGRADAADRIASERGALDSSATAISDSINAAHQAGFDANGAAGSALFTATGRAVTLTATPLSPNGVAAADGASASGNMVRFGQLRGNAGPEAIWADLQARQGQATASAKAQSLAGASRREAALAARDTVSEVDLDREAADLIRFQQAYTAAAQVIQVARENMQALFNAI
ncbi:MAG: flagellar hook-associated protein FlgK [Sphingopyxis sp.]|nr:flagellar hook-associated protein FlgK [Sphingopyxis sp.]